MPIGSDGSYNANPQQLRANGHQKQEKVSQGGPHPHSIHIHHAGQGQPHAGNAHHVHIHHADGTHEHSDHGSFQEAMDHASRQGADGLEEQMEGETKPGSNETEAGEFGGY